MFEIDESKFGKRKYNRGCVIEGQRVLGGICRETKEIFLVIVLSCDKETLIPIIKEKLNLEPQFCQIVGKAMIALKKKTFYILM